jgi:uncharacterized protein YggL (DUF469 family)
VSGPYDPPKEHRFTKDNQPPGINKRKGRRAKKLLKEIILKEMEPMLLSCIEKVKETGDTSSFDKLLDRVIGKVQSQNKITHDVQGSLNKMLQSHFFADDAEE